VTAQRVLRVQPLILLGLIAAGVALAAPSARTVTIKVSSGLGGKIVVNSARMTLYHYTNEKKGSIKCTGACRTLWPPLLAGTAKPVAGAGLVAAKLGTIKRPDGGVQVTYNRLALYRYSGDKKPGETNGQGVERAWYAVTAAGTITKAKVTAATAPASTTTPVSSGGSSGGNAGGAAANPCPPGAGQDQNPAMPCYNY
jgi:predicted lipoprotein with Yx(FWY)xxD motif